MAAQAALITFAIHVRWPALWIVAALVVCSAVATIARRSARELIPGGIVLGIVVIGIAATRLVAHPIYDIEGDLLHYPTWHNMMTSLQNHPTWRERYLPTVGGAWGDPMPGVIAAQEIAKLPADQRAPYFYSWIAMPNPHAVDTFARKRFFAILHEDPRMVLETFLVIAPKQLWSGITSYHASHAAAASPAAITTTLPCAARLDPATDAPCAAFRPMCAALLSSLPYQISSWTAPAVHDRPFPRSAGLLPAAVLAVVGLVKAAGAKRAAATKRGGRLSRPEMLLPRLNYRIILASLSFTTAPWSKVQYVERAGFTLDLTRHPEVSRAMSIGRADAARQCSHRLSWCLTQTLRARQDKRSSLR